MKTITETRLNDGRGSLSLCQALRIHKRAWPRFVPLVVLFFATAGVQVARAATLTWNNGSGTWNWNTIDANWTGSVWDNSTPDNAIFNNVNNTVTLTTAITGGTLTMSNGGNQSGSHTLTLTGSTTLSLASLTINGRGLGGNVDSIANADNQRLTLNNLTTVSVSGNVNVGRGSLLVSGTTTLNITGNLQSASGGDWAHFVMSGGSVTAAGVDMTANNVIASSIDLNGGTLTTAYIYGNKYNNSGGSAVNFNGTTVIASADSTDFLKVLQNGSPTIRTSANIAAGGLILDTSSYAVTIANQLSGVGGLTKSGNGTLTLSVANSYGGVTDIKEGMLVAASSTALGSGGWSSTTMTWIRGGATLALKDSGSLDEHMHLTGIGVGGLGALRSLSGDNALTLMNNGGSSGPGFCFDGNTTVGVDAGTLTLTGFYEAGGSWGMTKVGAGTLVLTQGSSYTGGTTISGGTLKLSGSGNLGTITGTLKITNGATLDLGTTTQTVGTVGATGAGNGIVGNINNGTINLNGNNAYLKSGTFTMNLTGAGNSRLWIGGDANATVYLGGVNSSTFADSNSTIIGHGTTGNAGTVTLLSSTALGPSGQYAQLFAGTLDFNGQTGITGRGLLLASGSSSTLVNNNTSTAASYAGNINLNNNGTPNIGGAGSLTLSGVISNGSFTKTGSGILTLSGLNTYSGGTTIDGGTILGTREAIVGGASALGTATSSNIITINNGGVLTGNINNWLDNTNASSGGANAHTVVVNPGGLVTGASGKITGLGNITLNNGTLECNTGFGLYGWNGSYTLMGDITVGGSSTSPSYITTKTGAGGSANLQMSNGLNGVGGTRSMTVDNVTGDANSDLIISAQLINGTMIKKGAGTVELAAGSVGSSVAVSWRIDAGALKTTANNVVGGSANITGTATGTTFDLGGTTQAVGSLGASGTGNGYRGVINNGTIDLNGHAAYLQNGTFTMNLTGSGNSRLWIGGDANATVYLGGVNSSTFAANNSTIIGHGTTGNAGTVTLLSSTALGPSGQYAELFAGTLDFNGQTGITGSGLLLASGSSSTLVNNNTSTAASYAGRIDLNNYGTPNIGGAGNLTLTGFITNGGFTKTGSGTLVLTGRNTYTGPTSVDEGKLIVNFSIAASSGVTVKSGATLGGSGWVGAVEVRSGGTLSPGETGAAAFTTGALTLQSGAKLAYDLNTPGTSDQVTADGTLTLNDQQWSDFSFTDLGGLSAGGTYTLIHATGLSGSLGAIYSGSLPGGLTGTLSLDYVNQNLNLSVNVIPEPSTLTLVGLGLLGAVAMGRRFRRTV